GVGTIIGDHTEVLSFFGESDQYPPSGNRLTYRTSWRIGESKDSEHHLGGKDGRCHQGAQPGAWVDPGGFEGNYSPVMGGKLLLPWRGVLRIHQRARNARSGKKGR
ncbi:unnamed protein product, partial [Scytosiphon promiscuus]